MGPRSGRSGLGWGQGRAGWGWDGARVGQVGAGSFACDAAIMESCLQILVTLPLVLAGTAYGVFYMIRETTAQPSGLCSTHA